MAEKQRPDVPTLVALGISILALVVSLVSLYLTSLKGPDLNVQVAPFIRHVVDDASGSEAFFVPLTFTNDGARPATITALQLEVKALENGGVRPFYGQYTVEDRSVLGGFFTPLHLPGGADRTQTVAFYPLGRDSSVRVFGAAGEYEFRLHAQTSPGGPVSAGADGLTAVFRVRLSPNQARDIVNSAQQEYPFPLPIE